MQKFILVILTIVFILFNTGCSEEKNLNKNKQVEGNNNNIITPSNNNNNIQKFEIKGVIHANYVSKATIKLYGIENNDSITENSIATTTSDAKGLYTFDQDIPEYKAYLIEAIGGTYIDEATETNKTLESSLFSLAYKLNEEVTTASVTPATDVIVRILKKNKNFNREKRDDISTKVAKKFLGALSEEKIDLFLTLPIDSKNKQEVLGSKRSQKIYSTLMSGLSKLQKDTNKSMDTINEEFAESFESDEEEEQETPLMSQFRKSFKSSVLEERENGIDTGIDTDMLENNATEDKVRKYMKNVTYKSGDKVINNNIVYKCKPWPDSKLCSSIIYEPGNSLIWSEAWIKLEEENRVTEEKDIASKWKSQKYKAGDLILYEGKIYECKGWPYTNWCKTRQPGANGWLQAWKEYEGEHDIKEDELSEEDKKKYEDVIENKNNKNLEKPVLGIKETKTKYTLLIRASFNNKNNKPSGYILYRDNIEIQKGTWTEDEDTFKLITYNKNESSHTYFVKTYKDISTRTGKTTKVSLESKKITVSVKKDDSKTTDEINDQSILNISKTSFIANLEENDQYVYSDTIQITGGDGDGNIEFEVSDNNLIEVQKIWRSNDFKIIAKNKGLAVIKIYKDKSSDGKYRKSEILRFNVIINKSFKNINNHSSSKLPGKPSISVWNIANIKFKKSFNFKWNKWSGFSAKSVKLFIDDKEVQSKILDDFIPDLQGSQKGWLELPINNATQTTTHKFYIKLCNQEKCSKSLTKSFKYLKDNPSLPDPKPDAKEPGKITTIPKDKTKINMLAPALSVPNYLKGANKKEVTAYFGQWKIYARGYDIRNIPANKLTAINYGFIGIEKDGSLYSLDEYADFDKQFDGTGANYISPSYSYLDVENRNHTVGYIDKSSLKLIPNLKFKNDKTTLYKGNFKEMMLLKVKYPHLKVYPSIGGWTKSDNLFKIATDSVKRKTFAKNSVDFARKHGFDGIDIDWEFPVKGGENPNLASEKDRNNFTLLMQELRNAIESDNLIGEISTIYPKIVYSQDDPNGIEHPNYINKKLGLTIAVYSGIEEVNKAGVNYEVVKDLVDVVNIMSYDYHGSWEAGSTDGKTGHQSGLFNNNDHISEYFNTSSSYEKILRNHNYNGTEVVDKNKIAVGLAFYGRIAADVVSDANNGLGQSFNSTIQGTYEKGNADYFDIKR